jgi:hypothetical protein
MILLCAFFTRLRFAQFIHWSISMHPCIKALMRSSIHSSNCLRSGGPHRPSHHQTQLKLHPSDHDCGIPGSGGKRILAIRVQAKLNGMSTVCCYQDAPMFTTLLQRPSHECGILQCRVQKENSAGIFHWWDPRQNLRVYINACVNVDESRHDRCCAGMHTSCMCVYEQPVMILAASTYVPRFMSVLEEAVLPSLLELLRPK